jgi:hypothetical protein
MIRVILGFVVHADGEFLSRHVATDRVRRHMWRVIRGMHRHPARKPVSLIRKRAAPTVFANDRTALSASCYAYIVRSW